MQMIGQALETQLSEAIAIGLSVYAGQAIGGLIYGIIGSQVAGTGTSFFENTTLSDSVLEKMASDLTNGGGFHAFPNFAYCGRKARVTLRDSWVVTAPSIHNWTSPARTCRLTALGTKAHSSSSRTQTVT
jgi:hypothetical protein